MVEDGLRRRHSAPQEDADLDIQHSAATDRLPISPRSNTDPIPSVPTFEPREQGETGQNDTSDHIPLVRFSSEVDHAEAERSISIDGKNIRNAGAANGQGRLARMQRPGTPVLSIDTRRADKSTLGIPSSAPPAPSDGQVETKASSASPRSATRDRGYSLRRTIFNRSMDHERASASGSVIELSTTDASKDHAVPQTSRESGTSNKKSMDSKITPVEAVDAIRTHHGDTKSTAMYSPALPHYENWIQARASRFKATKELSQLFHNIRRIVLRISEIPPTKDGRRIDLDTRLTSVRLDERTGKPYIDNTIRSSRYNIWNFLPRQLWAQFSKLANAYLLFVSILQMIPGLSTTGTYTTIVPLLFFIAISIAKEGYDDLRRYKLDQEENNRITKVFRTERLQTPAGEDAPARPCDGSPAWTEVKWRDVRVGDVVKVERDQQVPADLVMLHSKGENNIAYIETMALDGETNLKSKSPPPALARSCCTEEDLRTCNANIVVEDPNMDLYNFEGRATLVHETMPLSNNEVVYRSSVLRNTPAAVGLVIYTGEECKIRMNASKNPRIKAPSLQYKVNRIIIAMVVFVLALAIFNTCAYQVWSNNVEDNSWYLSRAGVSFLPILVSFIIMFNTLIPLSLYVSLEIVKVFQRLLLNDIDMYDAESDSPMEARTSTINEELGQVSYIFSDKTGTLTDNSMKFRKLSVAGTAWLHDSDLRLDAIKQDKQRLLGSRKSKGKRPARPSKQRNSHDTRAIHLGRKSTSSALPKTSVAIEDRRGSDNDAGSLRWRSSARPTKSQHELHTIEMIHYIQRRPFTIFAKKARFFLLSVALCHTCLPEKKDDDVITYQAASPDELALVQAAQELGYMLVDRRFGTLTIRTFPHGRDAAAVHERYEVLDVIEFSSKRKRMSVVVRFPDQRICVISKGADSVIMNLLRLSALATAKSTEIERRTSLRKSIEARQVIARRSEYTERSLNSPLGRPSVGGISRASIGDPRQAYRRQVDTWLRDRERDVDAPVMHDVAAYTPRLSAQLPRPSIASSAKSSIVTEDPDYELVEEALVIDEPAVIERCFQHVNDFATEGLRTLLYGYRFVGEEEYWTWRKAYRDATTSLANRQAEIERAGELIEHSLELAGATAIEDKLQKGVPETIDKLRRAGIKMWMLTGDKRETAINIGHSCRLIKDYSTVTVLDMENPFLEQLLASTIVAITSSDTSPNAIAHSVVVIDGATLSFVEASLTLKSLFTDLATLVDSLICCRASPAQKASLVRSIRRKVNKSITLAIGDGANDIAMIQEAHVGIGITGKEGLQAARTSDYSIAQFRFLTKLLLVHGRWNYVRTAKYTLATFWKEMMFYLTQALFQRYAGYTGTSLYEPWSLTTFNTLFTSLPVIILGIFEKDLGASTLLAVPELYGSMGLRNAAFNYKVYAWWIFLASSEAMLIFFVMYAVYGSDDGSGLGKHLGAGQKYNSTARNSKFFASFNVLAGGSNGIFPLAALTFTAVVITISCKLQFLEMHNISLPNGISFFLSVGGWFLWNVLLNFIYSDNTIYKVKGAFLKGFGTELAWWATLLLILLSVAVLEVSWRVLRWVVGERSWTLVSWRGYTLRLGVAGPSDADVFQCLEKDPVMRARFEQAARADMPYSLPPLAEEEGAPNAGPDDNDGRMMSQKEREGEIEEILRKRGVDGNAENDIHVDKQYEEQRLARIQSGRSQSLGV